MPISQDTRAHGGELCIISSHRICKEHVGTSLLDANSAEMMQDCPLHGSETADIRAPMWRATLQIKRLNRFDGPGVECARSSSVNMKRQPFSETSYTRFFHLRTSKEQGMMALRMPQKTLRLPRCVRSGGGSVRLQSGVHPLQT